MANGQTYKIGIIFLNTQTGKVETCSLYLKQTTVQGWDVNDVGALVKDWWDAADGGGNAAMKTYFAGISLTEVTLRKWNPLEPVIDSYTTGLPIAGTASGEMEAVTAARIISLRTANIGRSYRGRIFLPAMSESIMDQAGNISNAEADAIAGRTASLLGELQTPGSGGGAPVVWSKTLSTATDITTVKVDVRSRSQRRRQLREPVYRQASV